MEQGAAQYWVLMKRKQEIVKKKKKKNKDLLSQTLCCNEETSWEERAFEKDHAAHVMWPPRSYPCSFCKREFRSAQALGGHMNVHRRDRARLKLGSSNISPLSPSSRVSSTVKVVRVLGDEEGDVGTNLSVGLNCSSQSMVMGCKRPKLAASSPSSLQFSFKPCSEGGDIGIGLRAGSMEDLDLELRLGHDPQVK